MAKNAECNAIIKHIDKIVLSAQSDLIDLSLRSIREGLITPTQGKEMINICMTPKYRAAEFGHMILAKVQQNSDNYYKFVDVLRESEPIHADIVGQLDAIKDKEFGLKFDPKILKIINYCEFVEVRQTGTACTEAKLDIIGQTWNKARAEMSLSLTCTRNFITFYKCDEEWMQLGMNISLETEFIVKRASLPGRHILQLVFPNHSCQIDLSFESMIKRNQWYQALTKKLVYHHVDLNRCHEFPSMEGEYVVEVCHLSYKVWPVKEDQLGWEWKFSDINDSKWIPCAQKLKVECQRSSKSVFCLFFSGRHASHLCTEMQKRLPRQLNVYEEI